MREGIVAEPSEPLGYQARQLPRERRKGVNWFAGLLLGFAVDPLPWGIVILANSGRAGLAAVAAVVVSKVTIACVIARRGRRPGFASGLLVSLCVVLLAYGCLLGYAVTHLDWP